MTFSEHLAQESHVTVVDGCQRAVTGAESVNGTGILVTVASGRPGTWRVSYASVSSDDGHASFGGYSFTVVGRPDCATTTAPVDRPSPDLELPTSSGQGMPVVLLGAGALVAAGLVVRRRNGPWR